MMKKIVYTLFVFAMPIMLMAQSNSTAYELYSQDGDDVTFSEMLDEISQNDVVFFGELHDNPISHWLEHEIAKALYEFHGDDLILGAEMFERDQQLVLDEYTSGIISEKKFEQATHFWPNYQTDYKKLVDFAADKNLPFIATNVPRRYASIVYNNGLEALEDMGEEAKKLLPPLPIPYDPSVRTYHKMKNMMPMGPSKKPNPNFPKAQAIKDATMAYTISEVWDEGNHILHFNGAFHSEYKGGIVWYLMHYNSGLDKSVITTVSQEDVSELEEENQGKADFIIVVDEDMTKTQ